MTPRLAALAEALRTRRGEARQAVRVMVGVIAAFAAYATFHMPQGYWAVFTVIIVMQGTVGGTVSVAVDRMIGTVAGALVGALAVALHPPGAAGLGVALALAVGVTTLAAAIRPNLKVAPVTAAIMMLGSTPGLGPAEAAAWRVGEIAVGAAIGVLATLLILPARPRAAVAAKVEAAAALIAELLQGSAEIVETPDMGPEEIERRQARAIGVHARLRAALASVETAMADAERQRTARLGAHGVPAAVARTLWRARNDAVAVGRAAGEPLPEPVGSAIGPAAAAELRAEAGRVRACAQALLAASTVERAPAETASASFREAFADLRATGLTATLSFEGAGRAWGLAFALANLKRDLDDLCDRVDEAAAANSPATAPRDRPKVVEG